jgi:C4-type Zn-finger protein
MKKETLELLTPAQCYFCLRWQLIDYIKVARIPHWNGESIYDRNICTECFYRLKKGGVAPSKSPKEKP